jgi:protein phosphatase
MGATVAAAYLADDTLIAANVGDSSIYLIHGGNIETLSVPHTVAAECASMDPGGNHHLGPGLNHVLTRGIGVADTVKPDLSEVTIFKDDRLVICSDGLSDKVAPQEIRDVALRHQPADACGALINLANVRGGEDNITVIVLKIKSLFDPGKRLKRKAKRFFNKMKPQN